MTVDSRIWIQYIYMYQVYESNYIFNFESVNGKATCFPKVVKYSVILVRETPSTGLVMLVKFHRDRQPFKYLSESWFPLFTYCIVCLFTKQRPMAGNSSTFRVDLLLHSLKEIQQGFENDFLSLIVNLIFWYLPFGYLFVIGFVVCLSWI